MLALCRVRPHTAPSGRLRRAPTRVYRGQTQRTSEWLQWSSDPPSCRNPATPVTQWFPLDNFHFYHRLCHCSCVPGCLVAGRRLQEERAQKKGVGYCSRRAGREDPEWALVRAALTCCPPSAPLPRTAMGWLELLSATQPPAADSLRERSSTWEERLLGSQR